MITALEETDAMVRMETESFQSGSLSQKGRGDTLQGKQEKDET